jgi:hypothetical protein
MHIKASSRKKATFAILLVLIALTAFLLEGCGEKAQGTASAPSAKITSPAAARTKVQGMNSLLALPELQAWTSAIDKRSKGQAHGGLMEYNTAPQLVNGKPYWQFSFVEFDKDQMHRWENFLVSQSSDEILVDDDASGKVISLEEWRRDHKPMER